MSNYKAIVAKIDKIVPIEGADKIQTALVLGEAVIVRKGWDVGMVGLFFPAGTQLSPVYCSENNLFRDKAQNKDKDAAGFFEDNRRVRAQPFLKVRSEGLFMQLDSAAFTGFDVSTLKVGDTFEDLNGVNIAKKYINPKTKVAGAQNATKARKKNTTPLFAEHVDTAQFKHNIGKINAGDLISIQSKKHGTSVRFAYTKVLKTLPRWKEMVNKVFKFFDTEGWDYVVGTRRVVLNDPDKEGFHGSEAYRYEWMEKVKPYLVKGMTLYGELVGYANGKPIMSPHDIRVLKDKAFTAKYGTEPMVYKYGCMQNECDFHVYRITLTTEDGTAIDFTQQQLVQWCNDRGIKPSHDLVKPFIYGGNQEKLLALVDSLTERPDVVTEDYHDPSHISEGVIVRVDRGTLTPLFLKNKSFAFKVLEGIVQEKEVDEEDAS